VLNTLTQSGEVVGGCMRRERPHHASPSSLNPRLSTSSASKRSRPVRRSLSPNPTRRDSALQLIGHLDISTVLVSRSDTSHVKSLSWETLFSCAQPFSTALWFTFVALILFSGVVDWIAERDHAPGHQLTASLYEYCAGVLWGGFEHPLSRTSAVYQIILAFIVTARPRTEPRPF
jgi:hypothetical protein